MMDADSDEFIFPLSKKKKEREEQAAALLAAYKKKVTDMRVKSKKFKTTCNESYFFGVSY